MPIRTVQALEDLQEHDLLLVLGDTARIYAGAGATIGTTLALAREAIGRGTQGSVRPFVTLSATARRSPREGRLLGPPRARPVLDEQARWAATYDAQIGDLWVQLASAVAALWVSPTTQLLATIESDELMLRSTVGREAFGFVRHRRHRRFWGWYRTATAIQELWIDLIDHAGSLRLVYGGCNISELDLVLELAGRIQASDV